jgi:hypothetical protein
MPRGVYNRKESVNKVASDLTAHEALAWEIAEIMQQTNCAIKGCQAKFHLEDANRIVRKIIAEGLIN